MQTILPKEVISGVLGSLSRAGFGGQRVHTAVGATERGSARFSNLSILQYADMAAVQVAARVRAEHVQDLFTQKSPPFPLSGILRLLGTSPNVNGTVARRRTQASNEYYKNRGSDPTDEEPAWIFESGEFYIEGASENPSGAAATFVDAPLTTKSTESSVSLSGGNLSTDTLTEKHEETILYLDDGSNEHTARVLDTSVAGTDVDTDASGGSYDVSYFDHACSQIDRRHETAIVELAAAFCFASMAEQDALEASLSNFGDEINDALLPTFDLRDQSG